MTAPSAAPVRRRRPPPAPNMRAELAAAPVAGEDPACALARVRHLALARFPRERGPILLFLEELERRLPGQTPAQGDATGAPVSPGSFDDLLTHLEELLEALLAGE